MPKDGVLSKSLLVAAGGGAIAPSAASATEVYGTIGTEESNIGMLERDKAEVFQEGGSAPLIIRNKHGKSFFSNIHKSALTEQNNSNDLIDDIEKNMGN